MEGWRERADEDIAELINSATELLLKWITFCPPPKVIQFSGSQLCSERQHWIAPEKTLLAALFGALVHLVQVGRERDMSIMGGRSLKAN